MPCENDLCFSPVPEAPSLPAHLAQLIRSPRSQTTLHHSSISTSAPPSHLDPSHLVSPSLPIPHVYVQLYPTLRLRPYSLAQENRPSNVLSFLHNAAKREVADLVAIVIPALANLANKAHTDLVLAHPHAFGQHFHDWWRLLLRFFFFVADTNLEIINLIVQPVINVLTMHADHKALKSIHKQRKSISDRYDFAMEFVFRAADKAIANIETLQSTEKLSKAVEKLDSLAKFVLDTLQLVINLADELEIIMPDLEIGGLEYIIADNASIFGKTDKPVFIYTCARWMDKEEYIKPWIAKYAGFWGRIMFKSWQKAHHQRRAVVLDNLSSSCLTE